MRARTWFQSLDDHSGVAGTSCELWCMMGMPSLGILAAADGAGLMPFCTSLRAVSVGVAMLVEPKIVKIGSCSGRSELPFRL